MSPYRVHLIRAALWALASATVFTTWMVYQIQVIQLSPLQLVLMGTALEVSIFVFEVPTGIVADLRSRRLSVIIGCFVQGAAFTLMGLIPDFGVALCAQVLWGLGYTFTSGAYDAWLVDEIGQERAGEAFLRGNQVGNLAGLVGLLLSVGLATLNLALPVIAGGALMLAAALFLVAFMPEKGFKPSPAQDRSRWQKFGDTFVAGVKVIRWQPQLMNILGVGIFFGLFSEGWDRLWQAHLITTIGLPTLWNLPTVVWIGAIDVTSALLWLGSSEIVRRRLDMNNPRQVTRALFAFTLTMVLGIVGYGLAPNLAVALGMLFAFGIARGLVGPLISTWSNQHIASNVRATVLSMQSQTDAIGQMVGGPPIGLVGQSSLRAAFVVSGAVLAPALWLLARANGAAAAQDAPELPAQS